MASLATSETSSTQQQHKSAGGTNNANTRYRLYHPLFILATIALSLLIHMCLTSAPVVGTLNSVVDKKTLTGDNHTTTVRNRNKAAIAALVSNQTRDVSELCEALESLGNLSDASKRRRRGVSSVVDTTTAAGPPAPVLIFHEGDLSTVQQTTLKKCTSRHVTFPTVNFSSYPPNFNPETESSIMHRRSKWGYQQMCRFWISTIWTHHAIRPYETILRLDSDACYSRPMVEMPDAYLPSLPNEDVVYWSHVQYDGNYIDGLWDLAKQYVKQNNITPSSPRKWALAKYYMEGPHKALPLYINNFEVTRISFMLRPEIQKFHHHITEQEPYGVYRQRWGDAPVRYLTMALFATEEQVMEDLPWGYWHSCKYHRYHVKSWKQWYKKWRDRLIQKWKRYWLYGFRV